jgi:hypothetical protein
MKILKYISVCLLLFFTGCATQKKTSSVQSSKYSEDLSALRPPIEIPADQTKKDDPSNTQKLSYVEAKYSINKPLDTVLDSIDRINLSTKYIDGFTIQLYSGLDREAALTTRKGLTIAVPDVESEVQYAQPNFRVKAGKYYTRLDAQKDFQAIKKHFPSAIVVPDKIAIN